MAALQSRHCPQCGAELAPEPIEGRERLRCTRCRFVLYQNPASASAGCVLDDAGRVLLVRRAIEPFRGSWALPAGYQEIDELPTETVVREVREETGLEVEPYELFDLLYVRDPARKPANLAVYLCRPRGGTLRAGDDALDVAWFPLDGLPAEIGFENRERILARLVDPRSPFRSATLRPSPPQPNMSQTPKAVTYAAAGVDIEKKYDAVERATAAIRKTFTPGVVGDVGAFGGLFDLGRAGVGQGMLVASADGVGTKLEVAKKAGIFDTVGRDIVHHCIDDILVQGAKPLFFMDYVGVGKMEPDVVSALIAGCAEACRENGLALLGGETAEMPGLYAPGDFDLVGFIVGIVEREKLLDGSRVKPGQVLLGLPSSGLHTNGFSLARKVLFDVLGLDVHARPKELGGQSVAEALLAAHRSYLAPLWPLLEKGKLAALAHITGGGVVDNVPRVLNGCDALVDRNAWPVPPIFRMIVDGGRVERDEAYHVLNMGLGMVLFVDRADVAEVRRSLEARGETVYEIGRTEAGTDPKEGRVRWIS
ncbi:MAG: phosphoribosylformylglycinamidine cyclo-ligase [Planctomycetes bacterium]|nr:phosphoribosylformylglycinamidine cyclo-ligase [Planctomycetota bacterium]